MKSDSRPDHLGVGVGGGGGSRMEKKNWQNKVSRRLGLKISAGGGGGGGEEGGVRSTTGNRP